MSKEKLEKLEHEKDVVERRLIAAKHREKYLENEMNLLIEERKKTLEAEVVGNP